MKFIYAQIALCLFPLILNAQGGHQKLQTAYWQFESDSQLKHASTSLYVINAKTGAVVFDRNSQVGLVPASTQKIITAATAFELLGKDFRYKTDFGYKGKIEKGILNGIFYLTGSGDPTMGSWRYESTTPGFYYEKLMKAIRNSGIENDSSHPTSLLFDLSRYSDELFNDNWIWQDLGNYYGISSCALNWRENQFDAVIYPGKNAGDPIKATKLSPQYVERKLSVNNQLTTGEKGSGDNSYFYFPPGQGSNEFNMDLKGSIPAGVDSFVVSASHPDPPLYFSEFLLPVATNQEIETSRNYPLFGRIEYYRGGDSSHIKGFTGNSTLLYQHSSPSLDSIIYWFLQKSINLYGEALIKTFAYHKNGFGSTDSGIVIEKNLWKMKGIDPGELNIRDGSGLSPQNRVTTHAEVEILKYAMQQAWFPYFLKAFPESNKLKLKSGSITDVKGFCGYCTSADGTDYIFSFLTNNYTGSPQAVINKMYKVLDSLK